MCPDEDESAGCNLLRNANADQPEIGIQLLEHQFQQTFNGEFDKYQSDWLDAEGWKGGVEDIDVSTVQIPFYNIWLDGDDVCDVDTNRTIFDQVANPTQFEVTLLGEVLHDEITDPRDDDGLEIFIAVTMALGANPIV